MKRESPDLFRVSPLLDLDELLKMQMQQILQQHDENGSVIYLFRVRKCQKQFENTLNFTWSGLINKFCLVFVEENCDPYKWPAEKVFRSNLMALENAIRDPKTQIGGLVVILDMAGVRFAHAKFLSPHLAKRSAEVIQDSFPMRFKAFHILHEPFYFDAVLALIKPFMSEKIRNRVGGKAIANQNECNNEWF